MSFESARQLARRWDELQRSALKLKPHGDDRIARQQAIAEIDVITRQLMDLGFIGGSDPRLSLDPRLAPGDLERVSSVMSSLQGSAPAQYEAIRATLKNSDAVFRDAASRADWIQFLRNQSIESTAGPAPVAETSDSSEFDPPIVPDH